MSSRSAVTQQGKLSKALNAVENTLEHLSIMLDFDSLECVHIDLLLTKIIDLPTESKQKNSRRNLTLIRQWMLENGAGVALLDCLGQVYWRLGDLNEAQFRELKTTLSQRQAYRDLLQNPLANTLVLQRIRKIQESKSRICDEFVQELQTSQESRDHLSRESFHHITAANTPTSLTPQSEEWIGPILPSPHLWRNETERLLIEFYTTGLCPERTLLDGSANTYLNIMQFAAFNESTRLAILSLSASYMKYRQKSECQKYHEADHRYMNAALQALMQEVTNFESTEACLATGMLLVHHAITNEAELGASWDTHFKMINIFPDQNIFARSDAATFITCQLILSETLQPSQEVGSSRTGSLEWLLHGNEDEVTQISGTTGLSRQVLSAVASITAMKKVPNRGYALELQDLLLTGVRHQWTSDAIGEALQAALDTAETYRIAALIYLHCRIFGLTPSHPMILQLSEMLYPILLRLPIFGPLYTAIYPIWPLVITCIVLVGTTRDVLHQRLLAIRSFGFGTTEAMCNAVSRAHEWLDCQTKVIKKDDWWEEMVAFVKIPETALYLG